MKTSTSILTLMVAVALAGCQVTVDDDRVSGALGSGSQATEDKARPDSAQDTNSGLANNDTNPTPTAPEPNDQGLIDFDPNDQGQSNPEPTEPEPTEPEPTEPDATEPDPTEPGLFEPEVRSVSLYWSAPMERVNGDVMDSDDIGGYEIRYRKLSESGYTTVVINDPLVEQYHIDDLESGDYQFEVAVFDNNGLYSDFVVAQ